MKKGVFVILAMMMATISFAQVKWDARVGVNLSGVSEGDMTMKFGVKAGAGVEYSFSDLFAIRPALFFSMKGCTDAKTPFDFSPENSLKLNYVELPVLASFRFRITPKFDLALNAGPSFGLRVSKQPKDSDLNSFALAADIGLDFVFNKRFVLGVEGQYGLNSFTGSQAKNHIYNYSLMFGYKF